MNVYSQTTNERPSIVNKSGKYNDSIIKHQWQPKTIPDSLLFDGVQEFTFPTSNIKYTPPKTFRLDSLGNIVHDWTGSTIQYKVLSTDYSKLISSISKETFEKQNFLFVNKFQLITNQKIEGTLYLIKFLIGQTEYERIVFFIGNQKQTLWLTVSFPVIMKSLLYEVFENSLLTIKL